MFGPRVKSEEADAQLVATLDALPGWRLADLKEIEGQKYRVAVVPIKKVGIVASAMESHLGGSPFGSAPVVRPLHEDGTPASDHAFIYPPSDKRADEELLAEYCAELRKKKIIEEPK